MNAITDLEPLGLPDVVKSLLNPRQHVLEQSIRWNPATWTERFAQDAGGRADLGQYVESIEWLSDQCSGAVSRTAVIETMKSDTVGGFLAAMIWGFGTTGYGAHRTAQIVANAGDPPTLEAKLEGIRAAAMQGHNEARRAIVSGYKLKGLGPAFGTKVAYFAARTENPLPDRPIPLIADFFTSRAFWHLTGNVGSVGTAAGYDRYVRNLHRWTATAGVTADYLEWKLFELGKRSKGPDCSHQNSQECFPGWATVEHGDG